MERCPKCNAPYGVRGRRCYRCEAAERWKPKPWFDHKSGYLKIRLPNRGRKMYFHRWIMEQAIGRELKWPEVVHHRNGDKRDNRLENLALTTASEHLSHHKTGANKPRMGWSHKHTHCVTCGRNDVRHKGRGRCVVCASREYEKHRVR